MYLTVNDQVEAHLHIGTFCNIRFTMVNTTVTVYKGCIAQLYKGYIVQ